MCRRYLMWNNWGSPLQRKRTASFHYLFNFRACLLVFASISLSWLFLMLCLLICAFVSKSTVFPFLIMIISLMGHASLFPTFFSHVSWSFAHVCFLYSFCFPQCLLFPPSRDMFCYWVQAPSQGSSFPFLSSPPAHQGHSIQERGNMIKFVTQVMENNKNYN